MDNKPTPPPEHLEMAKSLMEEMMCCNGAVNIAEPLTDKRFGKPHLYAIARAAGAFFDAHPDLLNDDVINQMADGDWDENQETFGIYPEYKALDDALNEYFDSGMK